MSAGSASDSETEFWSELEQPRALVKPSQPLRFVQQAFKTMQPEQFKQQLVELLPEGFQRDKLWEVLDQIRVAAHAEHLITLQLEIKKLHKFYKKKLHDVADQNRKLIEELRVDYDKLTLQLTKKDQEITRVQKLLTTQEEFISRQRITKEGLRPSVVIEEPPNPEKKAERVKALKLQIDSFRNLVEMYKDQADHAKQQLANCQQSLRDKQKELEETIEKKNQDIVDITEKYEGRLQQANSKFKLFKGETQKELDVCHIVNYKQTDLIKTLQTELRSAKIVLQTPRLRTKYETKVHTKSTEVKLPPKKVHPLRKWFDKGTKVWTPNMAKSSKNTLSTRASPGFSSTDNPSVPSGLASKVF